MSEHLPKGPKATDTRCSICYKHTVYHLTGDQGEDLWRCRSCHTEYFIDGGTINCRDAPSHPRRRHPVITKARESELWREGWPAFLVLTLAVAMIAMAKGLS